MSETRGRTGELFDKAPPHDAVDVSIILPAYDEADTIQPIYRQVTELFAECQYTYEILFVDDGSTDSTWEKIVALAQADSHVRAVRHRRNCGKASALANGFEFALGDIVVTSDADMQYDPNDILRLIDKINEGYDVVSARKVVRRDPLSKRIPSKFFNFFVRTTTGVPLHDINAGLKAFRHDAAVDLIHFGYGELHRFFVVVAARHGFRVAEVPVDSLYRSHGKSKYGAERYLRGALDFMTIFFLSRYAESPLYLLGGLGVWLSVLGTVLFWSVFFASLTLGTRFSANPLLPIAALLVVTGVQLLVAGLLAEMINNLGRRNAGLAKISQVLRVERREQPLSHDIRLRGERRQHTEPESGSQYGSARADDSETLAPSEVE